MSSSSASVQLILNADSLLLQVATSFVEKASLALGLNERAALDLTLASEEIFTYICQKAAPGAEVRLGCRGGGYYVEVEFGFEAHEFNMKAFNLTSRVAHETEESLEETGLLIASRMVDRFHFSQEGRRLRITLVKERSYPTVEASPLPEVRPLSGFAIREPDAEEVKLFVRLVQCNYPSQTTPGSFRSPGKVADMVSCGELRAAVAVDRSGSIGGGIVWRWRGPKLVQSFGPYVFNQTPESGVGKALVDACLAAVARTSATGIISRSLPPEQAPGYFEPLGAITLRLRNGQVHESAVYYRHLEEDLGLAVWALPAIEPFLRRENLVWQRALLGPWYDMGEFITSTSDGGFLLAGSSGSFASLESALLAKLDASGTMVWLKGYGDGYTANAQWVETTEDGGILVSGAFSQIPYHSQDGWIMKTDASGNAIWHKTVGGSSPESVVKAVKAGDGYLIVGDTYSFGPGGYDFLCMRVSQSWTIDASCPDLIRDLAVPVFTADPAWVSTSRLGNATAATATDVLDPGSARSAENEVICSTPLPVIKRISSKTSRPGSAATIYGASFSAVLKNNTVHFGNAKAKIGEATTTRLKVTIPKRIPNGPTPVYVVVDGKYKSNTLTFTVK